MVTAKPIATPTETAAMMTLAQWVSPAYPVGAFAYSHGLEAAVQTGWVKNALDLHEWLEEIVRFGSGNADARFIAAAYCAEHKAKADTVDQMARAFAPSRERLMETEQLGKAFRRITAPLWSVKMGEWTYPVALGYAAKCEKLPIELTLAMYLQAFVSNLTAAGQRLLSVGQTDAQKIVKQLNPLCSHIARECKNRDLSAVSSSAFLSDIAAMRHETQISRIFRT